MPLRPITDQFSVSDQITPQDMAAFAAQGIRTIICNRPDQEVPLTHQSNAMQTAAEAAGLTFIFNPIVPNGLTEANVSTQIHAITQTDGPVVAYCATGNRSTTAWALGVAGDISPDDVIKRAAAQGYDLSGLRSELQRRATGSI